MPTPQSAVTTDKVGGHDAEFAGRDGPNRAHIAPRRALTFAEMRKTSPATIPLRLELEEGVAVERVWREVPQPRQLGVDLRGAPGVGGAGVGVAHRGLQVDHDDVIHALRRPEAKRPTIQTFALCNDFN